MDFVLLRLRLMILFDTLSIKYEQLVIFLMILGVILVDGSDCLFRLLNACRMAWQRARARGEDLLSVSIRDTSQPRHAVIVLNAFSDLCCFMPNDWLHWPPFELPPFGRHHGHWICSVRCFRWICRVKTRRFLNIDWLKTREGKSMNLTVCDVVCCHHCCTVM